VAAAEPKLALSAIPRVPVALARLTQEQRPWVVVVAGDSTGNGVDEWIYGTFEQLAARYRRPLLVHNWDEELNRYVSITRLGSGRTRAPLVVWNGSAPGKDPEYSLDHIAAIAPEQPDLFLVNHGHNIDYPAQAVSEVAGLIADEMTRWPSRPAMAVALQNPRTALIPEAHAAVVQRIGQEWSGSHVLTIDAFHAFRGRLPSLLRPDGVHPNPRGSRIWTKVAIEALLGRTG
jgi:hypothetical protein